MHYYEALKDDWVGGCDKARSKATKTHWHTLLEDDTPLPATKKQKLTAHILETDIHSNMMLLRSPAGYRYEKHAYQAEDPAEQLSGIARYLEEFGAMWYGGVLGPDACSVFHNFLDRSGGRYHFLAPFFYRANIGSIDQWPGTSTDFPNIGPEGTRDRGDTKTISEQDIKTLFGRSGELENSDTLQARATLEALAKAAWGAVLVYGRCFRENFDPDSLEKVTKVKDDIGRLLGTLFSKAFNMNVEECLRLMNEQDLLNQTAREMNYWMTDHYVKDLREGLIPESVYPHYQGIRGQHKLATCQADFLSDEGFKGDYESVHLGAANGCNPLMALDALVVKLISYGRLNLKRPM